MALTDYDFSLSRNKIIEMAFRKVGAIAPGDSLPGEMFVQGLDALNAMVKSWQSRNVFLWTQFNTAISIVSGTTEYDLSTLSPTIPQVLWLNSATLRDGNIDDPLEIVTYSEFQTIPDKTATGKPITLACDNRNPPTICVWPEPNANFTVHVNVVTRLKDLDVAGETGDFPPNWQLALAYGLAEQLADEYMLPINERKYLQNKAHQYFAEARGKDTERVTETCVRGSYRC